MPKEFTIGLILYGDYPQLASRLLGSISLLPCRNLYIGLNEISLNTRKVLGDWLARPNQADSIVTIEEENGKNVGKYPLMRQMLQYVVSPYFMWFDDDSYLNMVEASAVEEWLFKVQAEMAKGVTQLGAIHKIKQRKDQYLVIRKQPWYNRLTVTSNHHFTFATGGWWTASTSFLQKWDYPFLALHHNGGDSILGELIRQQGKILKSFEYANCRCESCEAKQKPITPGVMINVGGRKGRRGIGVTNEYYVWSDGNPDPAPLPRYNYKHIFEKG